MGDNVFSLLDRELLRGIRFHQASASEFGNGTVYHYTGAAGVKGILQDRCLWATNFSFLNDPLEVAYGRDLVLEILDDKLERVNGPLAETPLKAIQESFKRQAIISEVYVCCFTECRDDLSQWRAYGRAAAARYCIGFDLDELSYLVSPPGESVRDRVSLPRIDFTKVIYEKRTQRKKIQRIVDAAIRVISKYPSESGSIIEEAALYLARSLPSFKSPYFEKEQEWRVIRWVPAAEVSEICFDTARDNVRPYIKFPVLREDPLPVTELLVLAPDRQEISRKAADMLLRREGLEAVQAVDSQVPFAEW